MRVRRVFLAAALFGVLGCSAILGIDGDYVEAVATADGGPDATLDGGAPDAVSDSAPEAAPVTFCTTWDAGDAVEVFCDDFDQGKPLGYGWNGTWASDGGSLELSEDGGLSPPRAVALTTGASGLVTAYLRRSMDPAPKRAAAQIDLRVDDWAQANGPSFSVLSLENTSPEAIFIIIGPNSATLWESKGTGNSNLKDTPLSTFPLKGTWTRARIEVDLLGQKVSVYLDGKLSYTHALTYAWPLDAGLEMYAGSTASYPQNHGQRRFRIDNAILERH